MDRALLNKFFRNECSLQESKEVLKWVNSFESRKDFEKEFVGLWGEQLPSAKFDWQKALGDLNERIEMDELLHHLKVQPEENGATKIIPHRKKKRSFLFIGYAAAVVILVFAATTLFSVFKQLDRPIEQASSIEYLTKSTEPGQKLTIQLEDGSRAILNSGSELVYPRIFSDSSRDLRLVGEAFFEVVGDIRPFTVTAGKLNTTVLGTSFNISAYPDQDVYEIALASGKLRIQGHDPSTQIILNPGEKASFDMRNDELSAGVVDPMSSFAWKDGIIYFKNADFPEIKSTLQRWFGVDIYVEGQRTMGHWNFSGKFQKENLKNILEVLKFSYDFDYKLEQKEVRIKF